MVTEDCVRTKSKAPQGGGNQSARKRDLTTLKRRKIQLASVQLEMTKLRRNIVAQKGCMKKSYVAKETMRSFEKWLCTYKMEKVGAVGLQPNESHVYGGERGRLQERHNQG